MPRKKSKSAKLNRTKIQVDAVYVDVIIRNRGSDKLLEQDKSSLIAVCSNLRDQRQVWRRCEVLDTDYKYITFKNMQSGMVLDNFAGTDLEALANDTNHTYHQWQLIKIKPNSKFVYIKNVASGNVLDHYRGYDNQQSGQFVQVNKNIYDHDTYTFHQWSIEQIKQLPPPKVCKYIF